MPLPRRKHIRLRNYDYREAGAYFVTVCTHNRRPILSVVQKDGVALRPEGEIVRAAWLDIPNHHPHVTIDAFVVMPDHLHGILFFGPDYATEIDLYEPRAQQAAPPQVLPGSLGAVVRSFKSACSRRINMRLGTPGAPVWQRGYWERVLRNAVELQHAREYIADNPRAWWEKYHVQSEA